jgi:glycosyltransferase involved in cell wall biosynthesis
LKVSLITVVFNRAATIEQTIRSVLEQTYPHIEYIVVDGASADGTLDIIQQYSDRIDQFISEKDNGVYDAINKGIRMATGDIIGLLHADDRFAHPDLIKNIVRHFSEQPKIECIFGDVSFVRPDNPDEIIRYVSSSIFNINRFQYGIMPAHPTFYCYKKFFDLHGLYRTDLDIAADFDLLLRFLKIHKLTFKYIPELMIEMNVGGKSTSGLSSTLKINREIRRVLKEHNISSSYLHLYSRYFIKIKEFF